MMAFVSSSANREPVKQNKARNIYPHEKKLAKLLSTFEVKKKPNKNHIPMQFLGPTPNGKYEPGTIFRLFSSLNRSGSNFSGVAKYFGSFWMA